MSQLFCPKDYKDSSNMIYAMQCVTKEEAETFTEFLHKNSFTWHSGTSYLGRDLFENYKEDTCYYFNRGTYDSAQSIIARNGVHYTGAKITLLHFSDFSWKAEDITDIIITDKDDKKFLCFMSPYLEVNNEV